MAMTTRMTTRMTRIDVATTTRMTRIVMAMMVVALVVMKASAMVMTSRIAMSVAMLVAAAAGWRCWWPWWCSVLAMMKLMVYLARGWGAVECCC